jgi:hypothetical protein
MQNLRRNNKFSNSKFLTSFFSGETGNKINFDINTEKTIAITTISKKVIGKKYSRFRIMTT